VREQDLTIATASDYGVRHCLKRELFEASSKTDDDDDDDDDDLKLFTVELLVILSVFKVQGLGLYKKTFQSYSRSS